MPHEAATAGRARRLIRGPQSFASGLALIAVSALALTLTAELSQGTLRAMGPAMVPRWLGLGIGLCGLALVAAGVTRGGQALERWRLRGPALIVLAIAVFAGTMRPVELGPVATPGLGLVAAGPLTVLIGGYASPEARLRELVALGLVLTAFCMVLFGDLLALPIPLYPPALADLFPAGWSSGARLRATAVLLAAAAALVAFARRARPASADAGSAAARETRRLDGAPRLGGGRRDASARGSHAGRAEMP